jgi:hypothetical protein
MHLLYADVVIKLTNELYVSLCFIESIAPKAAAQNEQTPASLPLIDW